MIHAGMALSALPLMADNPFGTISKRNAFIKAQRNQRGNYGRDTQLHHQKPVEGAHRYAQDKRDDKRGQKGKPVQNHQGEDYGAQTHGAADG